MKMDDFNLYTEEGWLNMSGIANIPGIWLIVVVGARQVGKTYGSLKEIISNDSSYTLYLRRTDKELGLITSYRSLNPFVPLSKDGINCSIEKVSKDVYRFGLCKTEKDEKTGMDKDVITKERGLALAFPTIAKLRGFNGSNITDLVFDEFIPEKIVRRLTGEGEAILNAYTTINGNRELDGKPPLKMWLLANAFDISSPILSAFGLTNKLVEMIDNGKEWDCWDGVFLAAPKSEKIVDRRKKTAMMDYLDKNKVSSDFLDMALENKFAYDSLSLIKRKPLNGYKPFAAFGDLYVWTNGTSFYVTDVRHNRKISYGKDADEKARASLEFYEMTDYYTRGFVTFSDANMLLKFREYFKIKR